MMTRAAFDDLLAWVMLGHQTT